MLASLPSRSAIGVHFGIVVLVIAAEDVLPPGTVVEIPLDRFLDPVVEFRRWCPAELIGDFRWVDRIALVMAGAVGDVIDQGFGLAELAQDRLDDLEIGALVVAADVVDLTDTAFSNDQVDRRAMVLDIEPVADVFALAIDRQGLVGQGAGNHQGDQFFREMVGAIVVGATGDRHRQFERAVVGLDQKICRGFGGGIG